MVNRTFVCTIFLVLSMMVHVQATDWYVRPAGGNYGNEDGTSYETAWAGILRVVWGQGGVQSGDTLWICGLHIHNMTHRGSVVTQADIIPISGTNNASRIIIRGDYPDDPGIIWGAYKMSFESWVDEGDGMWSITLPGSSFSGWFFQDISADSWVLLEKVNSIEEVKANPGSYYSTDYITFSKLYIKCTDGDHPRGRIYGNRWGYDWKLNGIQYVTFLSLKFYCPYRFTWAGESASHIKWQECTFSYGEHSLISLFDNCNHVEVIDCELSWAGNGIYTISNTNNAPSHYTFKGNTIHDMGIKSYNQNSDAHGIGIQGGNNGLIEGNNIYNCGTGITLYAFTNQELKNSTVRGNTIKNTHTIGGANSRGIETSCNNNSLSDKTGSEFHHNVVVNAEIGFRFQFEDRQLVNNNIASNCRIGMAFYRNYNGLGPDVKLRKNFFLNSTFYHIYWGSGARKYIIDSDYNLFYPASRKIMYHATQGREKTLSEWQSIAVPGSAFDPNSKGIDVLITDPNQLIFILKEILQFGIKHYDFI